VLLIHARVNNDATTKERNTGSLSWETFITARWMRSGCLVSRPDVERGSSSILHRSRYKIDGCSRLPIYLMRMLLSLAVGECLCRAFVSRSMTKDAMTTTSLQKAMTICCQRWGPNPSPACTIYITPPKTYPNNEQHQNTSVRAWAHLTRGDD
jgi:hypothetical protein